MLWWYVDTCYDDMTCKWLCTIECMFIISGCFEGDQGWCAVLHDHCLVGSWERGEDNNDPRGAEVWGCIPKRGTRVASKERGRVLHWSGTRSGSSINSPLSYGSDKAGRVEETNRGVAWETVYTA